MSEWENKWMERLDVYFYILSEKWHFSRTQDPLAMNAGWDNYVLVIKCSQLKVFRLEAKEKIFFKLNKSLLNKP